MAHNILIAGAGQLGSRYLQGLSLYTKPLNIWVYDISTESLQRAQQRWQECEQQPHSVEYIKDLEKMPPNMDMVFVTSNADVRQEIVQNISRITTVRYWILEKVLAQRVGDLNALQVATSSADGVWVNTPMYLWPLYRALRDSSLGNQPAHARFTGMNGLACNAIHYIDYVSRWNSVRITNIDTLKLHENWEASKRAGFYEVNGEMSIRFSDGSTLVVSGSGKADEFMVEINIGDDTWHVDEAKGVACTDDGKIINEPILRQSELTAPLLDEIFTTGRCDLPTLAISVDQHEPLLQALGDHWNTCMPEKLDHVPIT
jgi:hypothetical protein